MAEAIVSGAELELRFYTRGDQVCCEVSDQHGGKQREVHCKLDSMANVLQGLRYHFAGANVLCTICDEDGHICFDLQFGKRQKSRLSLDRKEYQVLINRLRD